MPRLLRRIADRVTQFRDLLAYAPAARWTAIACLVVFAMQRISSRVAFTAGGYSFEYAILHCFGLCPDLLGEGFFWQPVTYLFLHANGLHLLFNTLAILLLGAGVEMEIGTRRFLRLLLLGGIVGGLTWALYDLAVVKLALRAWAAPDWLHAAARYAAAQRVMTPEGHVICIGASGGVFALVGACAALFPRRRMIVFFVWSVPTRRLAIALGIAAVLFVVSGLGGNVAHLTHLAGGIAGYFYGRRLAAQGWGDEGGERE